MTIAQRKRLAREARKLAMECVEGTAPPLGRNQEFLGGKPHCALGHVAARCGVYPPRNQETVMHDIIGRDMWWVVSEANDDHPDALPWALLFLADALEEAAP